MRSVFIILGVVVLFCLIQNGRCDENSENLEAEKVTFENSVENGRNDMFKEWERDATLLVYKRVIRPFVRLDDELTHIKEKRPIVQALLKSITPRFEEKLLYALNTVKEAFIDRLEAATVLKNTTNENTRKLFDKMKAMSKGFVRKKTKPNCKEYMIEKIAEWELIYVVFTLNCEESANLLFSLVRMPHRKLLYQMNKNIIDAGQKLESCKTARFLRSKKYPCFKRKGEEIKADYEKLDKLAKEMHHRDNIDAVEMKASKWLANACAESFMENYADALNNIEWECEFDNHNIVARRNKKLKQSNVN